MGVPSSCRHPPERRPPGRFKSSRFSHFPNVISGNCWRKERRRCRKSNPRVDIIIHIIQRQDSVCARRGSEGAPSPPCTAPAFYFLARDFSSTPLTFVELFLKQRRERSLGSPTTAPKQSGSSGGRCWEMPLRGPQLGPGSCDAQSTGTDPTIRAGLVVMLPSGFKASPRASPSVPARQHGCLSSRSRVSKELQLGPKYAQGSLQTPSPALTYFWVPFFHPLKSLRIPRLHKPPKLLQSD